MRIVDAKYFGVKLSPNRIKNNKGQLIVTGCTFARTGKQKYHNSELGLDGDDFKYLDRPVEEVSSPAAIASFEGAPLTLDHPEDDVKVGVNWDNLAKGLATNVKYVADSDTSGHLEADLIFTDPDIINKVINHEINELSAGYNCEVDETTWTQRKIRGNHIAIVESARAGHQAVIRDGAYKSVKKNKVITIGDKQYKIVDSYTYELVNEEGKVEKFKDYLAYNDDGHKEVIKTVKVKAKDKKVVKDFAHRKYTFDTNLASLKYHIKNEDKNSIDLIWNTLKKDIEDYRSWERKLTEGDKEVFWKAINKIRNGLTALGYNIEELLEGLEQAIKKKKTKDANPEQEILAARKTVDQDLRSIFVGRCFEVEGFYNGVDSTEGSIFIVDYNHRKDDGFRKYRSDNLVGRYNKSELLDEAVYYIEKEYSKKCKGKYDLDVFVTDEDDEYPITIHIYPASKVSLGDSQDSELVSLLVAHGICATKKEATKRVKGWTKEQKEGWMNSFKNKSKQTFYEDSSYSGVETFLKNLIVYEDDPKNKLGKTYIRALGNNEKLPRGVYFKGGTDRSGIIHYKGQDYYYDLDYDNNLHIEIHHNH